MTRNRLIIMTAALVCFGMAVLLMTAYLNGGVDPVQDALRNPAGVTPESVVEYVLDDNVAVGERAEAINAIMKDEELSSKLSLPLASHLEGMPPLLQRSVLRNFRLMSEVKADVAKEIAEYLIKHASENDDRSWFAALALGNVRPEDFSDVIIKSLLHSLSVKHNVTGINDGPQLRNCAADALGNIGQPTPEVVSRLTREALSEEDVDDSVFRVKCARALVEMGVRDGRIIDYLKYISESGRSEYVRSMAEVALEEPR